MCARDALDILIASENQKIAVRVGLLTVVAIVRALLQLVVAIAAIHRWDPPDPRPFCAEP